jgi:AcrR family transcriptional regulator
MGKGKGVVRDRDGLAERIYERAGELFYQYGFKRVTMDDIAHRMGVSKKTIYQALPGKEALIESFIMRMMVSKLAEAEETFEGNLDIIESSARLFNFMRNRMSFISPAMVGDLQRYYPHLWDRINERRLQLLSRYLDKVEEAQQQGLIRDDVNPKIMVRMIEVFVTQVATPQTIVELDVPLSDVMGTFVTVMLEGALTDEGRGRLEEAKR